MQVVNEDRLKVGSLLQYLTRKLYGKPRCDFLSGKDCVFQSRYHGAFYG